MLIKPLRDLILIRRLPPEEVSSGGIFIPDLARSEKYQGEVVAVGPGRQGRKGQILPMWVPVGARVLFNVYTGSDIEVAGEEYVIMRQGDILGNILPALPKEEI